MNLVVIAIKSVKMGSGPVLFNGIHIDMPIDSIYRRLGFRRGTTDIGYARKKEIDAAMEDAGFLVELKGAALVMPIEGIEGSRICLDSGDVLESRDLSRLLEGSEDVLFMGASAGNGIMDEIGRDSRNGNLTGAVMLDAVASEMTDKALDWIMEYMGQELRRKGKELSSRRFSAGYGDFILENQRTMHRLLRLQDIGVSITETCILVPEKSVTALAGITKFLK